jgi:hypothetical protein
VDDFLFDTESLDDEEVDMSGYIPDAVRSSNDVFSSNAAVSFNIAYFRNRGLDSRYQSIFMNGLKMENLVLDRASNTQWGGLSRIFHSADCALNLNASSFAFGGFGGASDYNLRASSFRKQKNASYLVGNGNYNHRLMLTYASGPLKNGWSMVASASARFGTQMSYVEGVTYRGFAYFLAFEKQFNQRHSLNFATWGSPIRQGMQINCVPEVYNLVGSHYYNPNWGWYDGHRRNARNRDTYEPVALLTHNYNSENKRVKLTTSLGATFGHKNTTAFAFAKVADPHPDYFRYLPSYFMDDEEEFEWCVEQWQTNEDYRQIDWDALVTANEASTAEGGPSVYIIENRVSRHVQVAGTSILNYRLNDNLLLCAGIDVRGYRQHNYKEVDDLLGGEYWLGKDKYADTLDDPMLAYYDIDHAEAHLTTGDKFGYDYVYHIYRQNLWASLQGNYKHIDFHVGASFTATELWRTGYMRYGAYRDMAAGNSEKKVVPDYGIKAGLTYKIDAHNALMVNAQYQTFTPTAASMFVNALYSNRFIDNIVSEKNYGADLSYTAFYEFLKLRASVYYLKFNDGIEHNNFYHDKYGCFVNYTLMGVDSRHFGAELGAEIPIGKMFSITVAGHWGDFIYTSRPQAFISAYNGYSELEKGQKEITKTIYWKNYHVSGTPQTAATLGVKFSHKDWTVKLNANYFDKIYAALNPERRTSDARGFLAEDSEQLKAILAQERVKPQFTLDASIAKSWRIKRNSMGLSLKVVNLTNNKNLVTSLSEQHRFDYSNHNADAFPNKRYYAQGITFALGFNFTFN